MKKLVYVTTSFIGFHCWQDAPIETAYLRDLHRHKFNVYVSVHVNHNDRDVEFHHLLGDVNSAIMKYRNSCNNVLGSCEMIIEGIWGYLEGKGRYYEIRVDQDGENGAQYIYE